MIMWMAIAIALPMTFLSDWVIGLLYGEQYYLAGGVLMIHIWAGIFVALGVVRGPWLLSENLQKFTPIYTGVGMVSNIILNYFLIQSHGIEGAAFATLTGQIISVIIAPMMFKKTRVSVRMMLKSLSLKSSILRVNKKL